MDQVNNKNVYVLFHANCFDGTGAKYAAWKKFGDSATYLPVQYGKPFPQEVVLNKDTEVYILDFSYDAETLLDVNSKVGKLVVLDHHATAQENLKGLDFAQFDMDKSGAVLAWEYFHPGVLVPELLLNIQDGDLWKFSIKDTREIRAAIPILGSKMRDWDKVCNDYREFLDLIRTGRVVLKSNQLKVKSVLSGNVKVLTYKGYKVGVCNTTHLASEIGEGIYTSPDLDVDFSITYFFDKEGTPFLSFRSKGDMDVGALAKELGGGGHKNASGAKVTMEFIQKLYNGELA